MLADRFEDRRAPLPPLAGQRAEGAGVEGGEAGVRERGSAQRGADGEERDGSPAGRGRRERCRAEGGDR